MTNEKFTPEELYAGEAYCDNGALSHWEFVNNEGERIGIFVDEDATTIERMKRQEAYAHLFAAAPEMYRALEDVCSDCERHSNWEDLFNIGRPGGTKMPPCPCKDCYVEKALRKARGEE